MNLAPIPDNIKRITGEYIPPKKKTMRKTNNLTDPLLVPKMVVLTRKQYIDICKERFGNDCMNWSFVCPSCGRVQKGYDLETLGRKKEDIERHIGYTCVWCDCQVGGLNSLHMVEVTYNNRRHPRFDIAPIRKKK